MKRPGVVRRRAFLALFPRWSCQIKRKMRACFLADGVVHGSLPRLVSSDEMPFPRDIARYWSDKGGGVDRLCITGMGELLVL
jgi:hypothetical protein